MKILDWLYGSQIDKELYFKRDLIIVSIVVVGGVAGLILGLIF